MNRLAILMIILVATASVVMFFLFKGLPPKEEINTTTEQSIQQFSPADNEIEWTGKEMVFEQFLTKNRYRVKFSSDKKIKMILTDQDGYERYLSGKDGLWKATSQSSPSECCSLYGSYEFDINQNEDGIYYLILIDKLESSPTRVGYEIEKIRDI